MTERNENGKDRDEAGPGGATNARPAGANGAREPSAESDVLAFFYADAEKCFAQLRDDAAGLAGRSGRLGRFVGEAGLDAAADARREFHRACDAAGRVSELTFRLLDALRADLA